MQLQGKSAVITGATQGLGLRLAQVFSEKGANVAICGRNEVALEQARQLLKASSKGLVRAVRADVAESSDVQKLASFTLAEFGGIDVLVCNAGVYGPKGRIEDVNWDEWIAAVRTNLFGAVLCCREFLPHLARASKGKIIILSGGGATKPMPFLSAYAASKAAVVRFGETLAEEVRDRHIDVNMVAPGALNTRMLDEILEAGPERVGEAYYAAAVRQKASGGASLDDAAELCAYLAGNESDGISGRLLSAVWDPWRELTTHREDLHNSDIYTLRRILPRERGKNWG